MAVTEEFCLNDITGQCFTVIDIGKRNGKKQYVFKKNDGEILQFLVSPSKERSVFPEGIHIGDKVVFFRVSEGNISCRVLQAAGRPATLSNIRAINTLQESINKCSMTLEEKETANAALNVLQEYTGYNYYLFQTEKTADTLRADSLLISAQPFS